MKTLKNQTLLYDKDCPLCNAYTSGFIKANLLDHNGRKAYCELNSEDYNFVDLKRATNEIALIDTTNKTVIYGIDSLLKVFGHSMPLLEKIGHFRPIKYGLKKLYSFISYNRKVIAPSKVDKTQPLQCVPDFNFKYRYLFILFAIFTTTISLLTFSKSISSIPELNIWQECLIACGQIVFQSLFLLKLTFQKRLNYIGNLMTISMAGSLLLTPILIVNSIIVLQETILFAWFGLVVIAMLYEHMRRVKILELSKYLSLTWVFYRVLILLIILFY